MPEWGYRLIGLGSYHVIIVVSFAVDMTRMRRLRLTAMNTHTEDGSVTPHFEQPPVWAASNCFAPPYPSRVISRRISVISSIAKRRPSRPKPLSLTPP